MYDAPAPASEAERITVAVMPFQAADASGNRGEFEAVFMASALTEALTKSPWVARAFIAPVPTEAVDLTIEGEILQSSPSAVDVRLVCRHGDRVVLSHTYGIRMSGDDFGSRSSPVRRMWNRPTNDLGQALSCDGLDSLPPHGRIARYLGQPEAAPTDRVVKLFEKASEIERAKLLDPVTEMVRAQVDELEEAYVSWQRDSTRAHEQAARYRQEAAEARRSANDLKRSAKNTAAVGVGLSLLQGLAAAQSGSPVDAVELQANMQQFLDVAEEREARARETAAEAEHLARQAQVAFESEHRFMAVFDGNLSELTVTLQDRVYTLVGAVDAQIGQLRSIIRELAAAEVRESIADCHSVAAASGQG